jgi:hypothetical protein
LLASDPELFGNQTNLQVVAQDENGYTVRRKTGDKEGTLIRIERDPQTGEWVSRGAVGTEAWDTNAAQRFQNMGFGSVVAAALAGAAAAGSGLVSPGVNGLASGAGATEAAIGSALGGNALAGGLGGAAAGSAAGLGGADAVTAAEWFGGPGAATNPSAGLFGSGAAAAGAGTAAATTAASTAAKAAGAGELVKSVADMLGISESAARLLVTATPALAALLSDHDDQTTTQTQGTPAQIAARDAIATNVTGRLPEMQQRDRQRADQQMAWGNLAVGVPDMYTRPAPIAAPSMVASAFAPGGQGIMGNYKPRGIFGV